MPRRLLPLLLLLLACLAGAAPLPYDPAADADAQVAAGFGTASASGRPLLLLFGANWCEDCRVLAGALAEPATAALLRDDFVLVKVDVGNFDRNMDLAMRYGNPIAGGIPAAVLLSPSRALLYATRAGELADARRMSAGGVRDFLQALAQRARTAAAQGAIH